MDNHIKDSQKSPVSIILVGIFVKIENIKHYNFSKNGKQVVDNQTHWKTTQQHRVSTLCKVKIE